MIQCEDIGVKQTHIIHFLIGLAVLLKIFAFIPGGYGSVLIDPYQPQCIFHREGSVIIGSVHPVGNRIELMRPAVYIFACLFLNHLLHFNRIIQQLVYRLRNGTARSVKDLLLIVNPAVILADIVRGSRRYGKDFPFHGKITPEISHHFFQMRIFVHIFVDGNNGILAAQYRCRLQILHYMNQFKFFACGQHQVCFLIPRIPGYPDQLHFQVHPVFQQLLIHLLKDISLIRPLITGRHISDLLDFSAFRLRSRGFLVLHCCIIHSTCFRTASAASQQPCRHRRSEYERHALACFFPFHKMLPPLFFY